MDKETKNQLKNLIKTLKADIKMNDQKQEDAHKNHDAIDYFVRAGVCEGLEIAIKAIKDEFGD